MSKKKHTRSEQIKNNPIYYRIIRHFSSKPSINTKQDKVKTSTPDVA
jgi:hypothetical protein